MVVSLLSRTFVQIVQMIGLLLLATCVSIVYCRVQEYYIMILYFLLSS
jgi:hypothetical protein